MEGIGDFPLRMPMVKKKIIRLIIFVLSLFILLSVGCSEGKSREDTKVEEFQIEKIPEIQQVRPQRPVKIKVKRDVQGRYSWELTGENPDEIIRIDKRLRRAFVPEQSGQ